MKTVPRKHLFRGCWGSFLALSYSLKSHKQLYLSNKVLISNSGASVNLKQHLSPKNLRSLQHTPNRHRQISTAQKIPLFSKTQLEAIVPYITQSYSWSTQGSHFQALPTLRQRGHTLSSRTTSWSEKQEWSTGTSLAPPEQSCKFHTAGRKPGERIAQPSGWVTW